jgi:asparagine synthase (glutamine-hydrolysing)
LDRSWVNYYLSITPNLRFHAQNGWNEKHLLRSAFSLDYRTNIDGEQLLPDNVLWRRKEAFSDGVSQQSRSLFQIIQEYVDKRITDAEFEENASKYAHNTPTTKEQYYYRKLFESYYPNLGMIVPYFWMPKYVEAKDASARTLTIY